jgi:ribosomal protein S18 acetylase RimI-like enzyme
MSWVRSPSPVELEALVPDALYVNVLAALPDLRRRGFGKRLMQVVEEIARAEDRPRLRKRA